MLISRGFGCLLRSILKKHSTPAVATIVLAHPLNCNLSPSYGSRNGRISAWAQKALPFIISGKPASSQPNPTNNNVACLDSMFVPLLNTVRYVEKPTDNVRRAGDYFNRRPRAVLT
jgi:hypothetical protein